MANGTNQVSTRWNKITKKVLISGIMLISNVISVIVIVGIKPIYYIFCLSMVNVKYIGTYNFNKQWVILFWIILPLVASFELSVASFWFPLNSRDIKICPTSIPSKYCEAKTVFRKNTPYRIVSNTFSVLQTLFDTLFGITYTSWHFLERHPYQFL